MTSGCTVGSIRNTFACDTQLHRHREIFSKNFVPSPTASWSKKIDVENKNSQIKNVSITR